MSGKPPLGPSGGVQKVKSAPRTKNTKAPAATLATTHPEARSSPTSSSEDHARAARPPHPPAPPPSTLPRPTTSTGAGPSTPASQPDTDALADLFGGESVDSWSGPVQLLPSWSAPVFRYKGGQLQMPRPPLPPSSRDDSSARPPNASTARKDQDVMWLVRQVPRQQEPQQQQQQQQRGSASQSLPTFIFTEIFLPYSSFGETERNQRERQIAITTEKVRWCRAAGPPYLLPATSTSASHIQASRLRLAEIMRMADQITAMTDQPVIWINPDRHAVSRMYRAWVQMCKAVYGL